MPLLDRPLQIADPIELRPAKPQNHYETDWLTRAEVLGSEFALQAARHDREGSFPFQNFEALHDSGLLGLTIPVELGGQGADLSLSAGVIERIAQGDAPTALVLTMHYLQHAIAGRSRRWPQSVYHQLCRESIQGIALLNAARVEPELGTPARGGLPATIAEKTASGWQISGHKIYTTGSPILSYFVVWARTLDEVPQVGSFLVPRHTPGVKILETWDHLGMRATGSHDLILEQAIIPAEYALDVRPLSEWRSLDPAQAVWGSILISALYQGVATAARNWLVNYLQERVPSNLNHSLASLPRFQLAMGEIEALLYANHQLIYGLATNLDRGSGANGSEAQTVKYLTTNNAIKVVQTGLELTGNPGLSRRNPLERHYRDVLCSRIHTPQDDAICVSLGKKALEAS
ncbi:MAG: acyl-CoA dehydrogenase family protein [Cyanobacteriota bacterium]|nr:acyl-CoA dehydrogenase family protein [Cyanobacteriota bacterium]